MQYAPRKGQQLLSSSEGCGSDQPIVGVQSMRRALDLQWA